MVDTLFTHEKRAEFLETLRTTGNVSRSARVVGISRQRVYELKRADAGFAAEWDDALEEGVDNLEEEARRRAYEGTLKPVFYQGAECGQIREYSDTLMIVLLKAHRPDKYRDRSDTTVTHQGGVRVMQSPGIADPAEWDEAAEGHDRTDNP